MDNDFTKCAIKCQITDFVEDHFVNVFDIFWQCVFILGNTPADFKLIFGIFSQLHAELCQHFATCLCRSYAILPQTGKFYIHRARFPRGLCVVSCMHRTDWSLHRGRPTSEPLTREDLVDVS